jgi:periplasmic protein TonB
LPTTRTITVTTPITARRILQAMLLSAGALAAQAAVAQFSMVPTPQCKTPVAPSDQDVEQEFRIDAARHLYACFPMRVYRGKLPPLLYGVMMVETELDATGNVVNVNVVRRPAADEVAPWIIALVKRAGPFPAPAKMTGGTVKYTETYFVDKSGLFQAFSLTEGQR